MLLSCSPPKARKIHHQRNETKSIVVRRNLNQEIVIALDESDDLIDSANADSMGIDK